MSRKRTTEEMKEIAAKKKGKLLSEEYVNAHTKLWWQCEKGHVFFMKPTGIINDGRWCPKCSKQKSKEFYNYKLLQHTKKMAANYDVEAFHKGRK